MNQFHLPTSSTGYQIDSGAFKININAAPYNERLRMVIGLPLASKTKSRVILELCIRISDSNMDNEKSKKRHTNKLFSGEDGLHKTIVDKISFKNERDACSI